MYFFQRAKQRQTMDVINYVHPSLSPYLQNWSQVCDNDRVDFQGQLYVLYVDSGYLL